MDHPLCAGAAGAQPRRVSILVWVMMGIALWHFTVLLPQRFVGGIIGSLFFATAGALASGWLLPAPGVPADNPPGLDEALWSVPGAVLALTGSYLWGNRSPDPDA